MLANLNIDFHRFNADQAALKPSLNPLSRPELRKAIIDAGNEGLIVALRRHFADREKEPRRSAGFPAFGKSYPKRYFWRGTRGVSVAENIRITLSSPARLVSQVSIHSPALVHKLTQNPPPIKPKGGRKYLAIPADPAAAAWDGMPRDFPGGLRLAMSRTPDGHWLMSLIAAANYKGKSTENKPMYWLVHKAQTKHDPNALPTKESQSSAITSAVRTALARLLKRA